MKRALFCLLLALVPLAGCGDSGPDPRPNAVSVSIYPLADLVDRLLPDEVAVHCLMPAGTSPHVFDPTPLTMNQVSDSRLLVGVGLGLDAWTDPLLHSANPAPQIFTFAGALELEDHHTHHDHHGHAHAAPEQNAEAHGHAHGPGEVCLVCDGPIDPHLWLDPSLVAQFVEALHLELINQFPEHKDAIITNSVALKNELIQLDQEYALKLKEYQGYPIVTYHNAFNRPAERYGLVVATTLAPIETLGTVPLERLNAAMQAIEDYQLKVIFAEPQFSPDAANMLAQRAGVEVLVLDPVGTPNAPDRNGYVAMMRYNLDTLTKGLSIE